MKLQLDGLMSKLVKSRILIYVMITVTITFKLFVPIILID